MDELAAIVRASGLSKHGELRSLLMRDLGLGHGDANALVHAILKSDGERAAGLGRPAEAGSATTDDVLDGIYTGGKAALRPIHDRLMAAIDGFGPFEIAPKKGYVSLRRKKQFAMIGPATNSRVELGLNMKGVEPGERLQAMPAGGMCNYMVRLTDPSQVDDEVIAWARQAYQATG